MNSDPFFAYARARYQVKLDRDAGREIPWTDDPILQTYRFCNVFREDDRTTAWFREHIREPMRDSKHVLLATFAFRWFNRIETWEAVERERNLVELFESWSGTITEMIVRRACKSPYVTGAYMVKTPAGMDKIKGVFWCIDQLVKEYWQFIDAWDEGTTIEGVVTALSTLPYMGPFYAYEVATDLRHTWMLEKAPDIMTWANPGPGAQRGLRRLLGMPLKGEGLDRYREDDIKTMNGLMQELLAMVPGHWPACWPRWEMRDVEHTLCEFDKYERARLGQGRPKQLFKPRETNS